MGKDVTRLLAGEDVKRQTPYSRGKARVKPTGRGNPALMSSPPLLSEPDRPKGWRGRKGLELSHVAGETMWERSAVSDLLEPVLTKGRKSHSLG